jgi:ankyrin repeat protein
MQSSVQAQSSADTIFDAVLKRDLPRVRSLLQADPSLVNSKTEGGTPLHAAAIVGDSELVRLLLDAGAEVNARTNWGATPLTLALSGAFGEMIGEREQVAELLFHHGGYEAVEGHHLYLDILKASVEGNVEKVKNLLQEDPTLVLRAKDACGWTPLHMAAMDGHRELAELLLANGADPNAKDNWGLTPSENALREGHQSIAQMIRNSPKRDVPPQSVLGQPGTVRIFDAVRSGNVSRVRQLLAEDPYFIRARDKAGNTALHWAAYLGLMEIAELQLSRAAEVDAKDMQGTTPLSLAAQQRRKEVAQLLLNHGANINAGDNADLTPLHAVAEMGGDDMVLFLLRNGANVNAKSNVGVTPLHMAASSGHGYIVMYLLSNGANVNATTVSGVTPLYAANLGGHKEVARLILQHGGVTPKGGGCAGLLVLLIIFAALTALLS